MLHDMTGQDELFSEPPPVNHAPPDLFGLMVTETGQRITYNRAAIYEQNFKDKRP
jgi:hypothetical protein